MVKSGLIVAAIILVLSIGVALLSPLCVPCVAILAGALAGYLACVWDKPVELGKAAQRAAGAGAISGLGALLGHLIGAVLNVLILGTDGYAEMFHSFGLDPSQINQTTVTLGALSGGCCFGLLEIVLMAGLGALGGVIWWQLTGKQAAAPPEL